MDWKNIDTSSASNITWITETLEGYCPMGSIVRTTAYNNSNLAVALTYVPHPVPR